MFSVYRFFLLSLFLLLSGCTSISWTDKDGFDKHLGLFYYELKKSSKGNVLSKTYFGSILKLSNIDYGYVFGVENISYIRPSCLIVVDSSLLLSKPIKDTSIALTFKDKSGFFYYKEKHSNSLIYIQRNSFGLDVGWSDLFKGLNVGFMSQNKMRLPNSNEGNLVFKLADNSIIELKHNKTNNKDDNDENICSYTQ